MKILRLLKRSKNRKGTVLILVMAFLTLMVLSVTSLSTMIQRDVRFIQRVDTKERARFMAEAGINHALGKMKKEGFSSRADFSGSMDTGSYSVTHSEVGERLMVTSVGTVSGVSETVQVEIEEDLPTALYYFSGAGNDIKMKIHTLVEDASIVGDIHANNDAQLRAQNKASFTITGDVSATGIVQEGSKHYLPDNMDTSIYINGLSNDAATVYEGADRISFPGFNYEEYKQAAQDGGIYYGSDQTFAGGNLAPGNGIVYVDGDVIITGQVFLSGGIIAKSITISRQGMLTQIKSGNRNVIIAKETDISVSGHLIAEEALVYADQDIISREQWGPVIDVSGILLAGRDIHIWNVKTSIDYTYVFVTPEGMEGGGFRVISWNR